jgi:hypothetical protein
MRSGIVSPFAGGRRWVVAAVGGITATLAAGLWLSLGRPSTPPMATAPVSEPTQDVLEAVRDLTAAQQAAPDSPAAGTALPGDGLVELQGRLWCGYQYWVEGQGLVERLLPGERTSRR